MPKANFLLQGVTSDQHLDAARRVLSLPDCEQVVISSAFVTQGGVGLLQAQLSTIAKHTTVFCGIRNGLTTAQGLARLLSLGCATYAVDTGKATPIFHPKYFLAKNATAARALIGSANLTPSGLKHNIEAGIELELSLAEKEDADLVAQLLTKTLPIISDHPANVLLLKDDAQIAELLSSGRVADETISSYSPAIGGSKKPSQDSIPAMKLFKATPETMSAAAKAPAQEVPFKGKGSLIWRSKPLTRRHLNIPTASGTNPTGSFLLGKGLMEGIDQKHHYRDVSFSALDWQADPDPLKSHLERSEAPFRLLIKGVDYGSFKLRITHNTRTDTATDEQENSKTQIHWDDAKPFVANPDLLGRTLSIYQETDDSTKFVIEID